MTENTAKSATPFNIKIPGYKLKQLLGKGGMASVYLAVQESFGRDVALKILAPDMARDKEFSERFLREAQIVSRLQHHNIVTVYDVGIHQGYHYLSMEYIPGQELREAKYDLSKSEIIRIIKEVARALDYAHKNGYIHRDVKPENIMLHENGERVVLMDFGIARMTQTDMSVTKTGKVIGTPHYMSPEQTKGLQVDHRTDIYSLGVVMFQMLAGRLPYDAETPVAVGIKHISEPIPLLPPGLEMFQTIINTCMSKDPAHRYQSAADLITALDNLNANAIAVLDARAKEKKDKERVIHDPSAATSVSTSMFEDETVVHDSKKHNIPPLVHPDHRKYQQRETIEEKPKSKTGLVILLLLLAAGSGWAYFNQPQLVKFYSENLEPTVMQFAQDMGFIERPLPAPQVNVEQEAITDKTETQAAEVNEQAVPVEEVHPQQLVSENTEPDVITTETAPVVTTVAAENITQPPATTSITSVNEIQQLQAGLTEHPENALQLAKIYEDKLANNPGDLSARNGLSQLREWYRFELNDAMDEKNLTYARKLVDQMQQSFPLASKRPVFEEKIRQLEHAEKIAHHLQRARQYFKQDALAEPVGDNAVAEYQIVLVLEPGNPQAIQGLKEIAETAYSKALNLHSRNKLKEATHYIDAGLKAEPLHSKLQALQSKVESRVTRISRHDQLNREAEALYLAGNMIIPEGESAYDKYKLVLKENPNNLVARSGLRAIEKSLVDFAISLMESGELEKSQNVLTATREKFGSTPIIEETEIELKKRIKATEPKILNVVFSDQKPATLSSMHNQKLKVYQLVYVGFIYKNFKSPGVELQANLLDGSGRILVSSKKITLPAEQGEMIFSMDVPTKRIADGGYKLELVHGVKKISAGAFINDNKLP